MRGSTADPGTNRFLARLPAKARSRLLPTLTATALRTHEILYEPGRPSEDVYFPQRGTLVAFMRHLGDGKSVAPALVGDEGAVGLEVVLDGVAPPFAATVLAGGDSLRIKVKTVRAMLRDGGPLSALFQRYVQYLLVQLAQIAGCNRFHPLEQLFCSLLLRVQAHVSGDEFELTHEQFARIAGVRRVGISQEAKKLQRAGLIRYRWGKVAILDRPGLQARACVCHQQLEQAHRHFLGAPPPG